MSAKVVWSYKMPVAGSHYVFDDEASLTKECACCNSKSHVGTIRGEENAKAFVDMMNAKEEARS